MRTPATLSVALLIAFNAACSDAADNPAAPKPSRIQIVVDGPGSASEPAQTADALPQPTATLKAEITADDDHLLLTIRLRNVGRAPIIVDKDLVLLPSITLVGANRQAVPLQKVAAVDKPSKDALKQRLVALAPGAEIRRQLDLRTGFRRFETAVAHAVVAGGGVLHQVSAYETISRVPENVREFEIAISFDPSGFGFEEGLAQYLEGIDTTKLYRGPLTTTARYRPRRAINAEGP
jgi:hypothetical protein